MQAILFRGKFCKAFDKGSRYLEAVLGIFNLLDARITQEAYEYTGDILAVGYTQMAEPSVHHVQMEKKRLNRAKSRQTAPGTVAEMAFCKGLAGKERDTFNIRPVLHRPA